MTWTTTDDLNAFTTAAGDFLRARPVQHTILLSVTASLRAAGARLYGEDAPAYGWWREEGGQVAGAFLWTPPRPAVVSPMPREAAAQLAGILAAGSRAVDGVNGCRPVAEAIAAAWSRRGFRPYRRAYHRLYRLNELSPPVPMPPGRARGATAADRELLLKWCDAFVRDIGENRPAGAHMVDDRLARGGWTLWDVDSEPVSMVGVTSTISGMARVAPVYTPEALRQRGYAGAVTAAVSHSLRNAGAREIVLFTNLANPTSNALYQRLGYRPVEDHVVFGLHKEPMAQGR
jgi:hypothetical protein